MDYIIEQNIGLSKIAILKCDKNTPNPKAHMDLFLSKYVSGELYNSYMDRDLNNPYVRVVIKGINDLKWERLSGKDNVNLFGHCTLGEKIKVIMFFLPDYNIDVNAILDELTRKCIEKDSSCKVFIDTHLDNPYIRVMVRSFDELHSFEPYTNQKL